MQLIPRMLSPDDQSQLELQQYSDTDTKHDNDETADDGSDYSDSCAVPLTNDSNLKQCLLQVRPHAGRAHQICRHLAYSLGSPIVGDSTVLWEVRNI